MDPTASNSFFQNRIINGKVKNLVDLCTLLFQHLIKLLCLDNSAGESIKNETLLA
uniref:KAD2 n=1 Tax=Arundo donax TaxID=35708 RepID=A0A0A8Y994_ARUDO